MTVIRPNSVAGINSITVQSGNSLAVHKSDGSLIRTITANSGVSTFSSISVGTATTDNSAAKSINIGLGASIAQHNDNSLTFGTNGDPRITIDASGDFNVGSAATIKAGGNATFSGIVTAASFVGDGSGLTGAGPSLTGSTNNTIVTVTGANAIQGEANLTFDGDDLLIKSSTDGRRISFAGDGTSHYMKYDNTLGGIILNGYGGIAFETNGTNERLRIDSSGRVIVGHTATDDRDGYNSALQVSGTGGDDSSVSIGRWSNNSSTPAIVLSKSRNGTIGSHTVVQDGDNLGMFQFQGDDGTNYHVGATISAVVDGTPGNDDMPGRLVFSTTADGATSATERLRINSDGTLKSRSDINGQAIHKFQNLDATSSSSAMTEELHFNFGRSGDSSLDLSAARIVVGKEGEWVGAASNQDGFLAFYTCLNESPGEKMRIGSNNIFLHSTNSSGSAGRIYTNNASANHVTLEINQNAGSGTEMMAFRNGGTQIGSITQSSSNTSYNTGSDYRLKENDVAISDGITRLKQLRPIRFNWKTDPSTTQDGFFAHEVQTIVPESVRGNKDELFDTDGVGSQKKGGIKIQQLDHSKLVPLLTAALQEEVAKREALETRVAALEGG